MDIIRDLMSDWIGWVLLSIIALVIALVLFLIVEHATATTRPMTVQVLDTSYSPARVGTGIGPNTGGNGGVTVLITSTPAEYELLILFPDGHKDFVDTNKETLLSVTVGQDVTLQFVYGGLSKAILGAYL